MRQIRPQFPTHKIFIEKWSRWVSWRMVRNIQRHCETEFTELDVEIIRGHLVKALTVVPPERPSLKRPTTAREDKERQKANRAKRTT